jgi:ABC-type transport system involved in Fe-S cluster assembly fused permease/ATPase subunit
MMLLLLQGIADGSLTVGDAVLFVTLMQQLYGPLNFFGSCEADLRGWKRQQHGMR